MVTEKPADAATEQPATAKKATRKKPGRKPGRRPGRPKGARRGPGRPKGSGRKAAAAGSNGAFLVRVKQGRGWREESQPSLAAAERRVLTLVFSGTSQDRIEVYQKQQVSLSVDLAFSPAGVGTAAPAAPAAPIASSAASAPATRGPGRLAGKGGRRRRRTTNLRDLIRKTVADLGGSANVADIKNALWDSGKTGSGSPRSLYNSISQAIRRYKDDFALKGRGLVALKG